jgi:hypothetical protein
MPWQWPVFPMALQGVSGFFQSVKLAGELN